MSSLNYLKKIRNLLKSNIRKIQVIAWSNRILYTFINHKRILISFRERITKKKICQLFFGSNKIFDKIFTKSGPLKIKDCLIFNNILDFVYYIRKKIIEKQHRSGCHFFIICFKKNYFLISPAYYKKIIDITYRLSSDYRFFEIAPSLLARGGNYFYNKKFITKNALSSDVIRKVIYLINNLPKNLQDEILQILPKSKKIKVVTPIFYSSNSLKSFDSKFTRLPYSEVSPFGVITSLSKIRSTYTFAEKFKFFLATASLSEKTVIPKRPILAGAISKESKTAKLKAFVEAIERYSAGEITNKKIINVPLQKIKNLAEDIIGYKVNLSNKLLYPCTYGNVIKVSENNKLMIGNKTPIPMDLVFYPVKIPIKKRFYYANSSGCAAHHNYKKAIINALLELSERDSLVLSWLNKLSLPQIEKKSLPAKLLKCIRGFEKEMNMDIYILDASLNKPVPCIMAAAFNKQNKHPYFRLGASSQLFLNNAIEKAFSEIVSSLGFIKTNPWIKEINPYSVITPSDHAKFYYNPQNRKSIEFLKIGDKVSYKELAKKYEGAAIKNLFISIGGKFIVVNLTSRYAKSLGLHVVRVISTKLIPIWFGNKCLPLHKERIQEIGSKFLELTKIDLETINNKLLFLHPFG